MTPAERKAMPLQESSTLWAEIMAKDLAEFTRLKHLDVSPRREPP
jgi:hypothetical protein